MMNNPMMQNIAKNPDFLKNALGMLKDPNNKGMLEMMAKNVPGGFNPNTLLKGMEFMINTVSFF